MQVSRCLSQSLTARPLLLPPLLAIFAHAFFWLSQVRLAADLKSVCRGLLGEVRSGWIGGDSYKCITGNFEGPVWVISARYGLGGSASQCAGEGLYLDISFHCIVGPTAFSALSVTPLLWFIEIGGEAYL